MSATLTPTAQPKTTLNGIDVTALQGVIETVRQNPAAARTGWAVSSRWAGGTRSDHDVESYSICGNEVHRPFTIRSDEPLELLGTNQFPNPQEYLLAAMNACMMVGYAAVAALMGITLTKLEIHTQGDIDLRGFLGVDESVPAGYEHLRQIVTIAGGGTAEQFRQLHETVKKTSPNYFNITRAIATQSRLVVE